jgi:putative phosphoesterase
MPALNVDATLRAADAAHSGGTRCAVLADIHGNAWALKAVLADVQRRHPDGYVLLGDLLADGPDPLGTLALLRELPNATFVQGNTDRYLGDLGQVVPPRSNLPDLVATWQWAVDLLGDEGCRTLANLPTDVLLETPAGPVLAAHGVPGDDEDWIEPEEAAKMERLDWHGARVLLLGHSHIPFVLHGARGTAINPGSVGISPQTGWRASYALLDLFASGQIAVQHVQVEWDVAAYVAAFEAGIPINRKAAPMLEALRQITDRRRPFALPNHPTTQPPNHRTT